MSIAIAVKKMHLRVAKERATYFRQRVKTCKRPSELEYCWDRWSRLMQECKRLKKEIAEAEGHHQAKERAFNGKFYPKSR